MNNLRKDPYRLVCVDCGSVTVRKRAKTNKPLADPNHHFTCNECGLKSKYVYDKKTGMDVNISQV